jgi:hypothetical protein
MPSLFEEFELEKCPHCGVDRPGMPLLSRFVTEDNDGTKRYWGAYACRRCGRVVTAWSFEKVGQVEETFPQQSAISQEIPDPARSYLTQALASLAAPAGATMLAASAVDAMLKAKGYREEGSLYARINRAAEDHVITREMAEWAHTVRLDANEPRHADDGAPLPGLDQAKRSIDFALALAELLFVLPSRVRRGLGSDPTSRLGG